MTIEYVGKRLATVVLNAFALAMRLYFEFIMKIIALVTKLALKFSLIAVLTMKGSAVCRIQQWNLLNSLRRCGSVSNSVGRQFGHVKLKE
jgi:hypothetical protein